MLIKEALQTHPLQLNLQPDDEIALAISPAVADEHIIVVHPCNLPPRPLLAGNLTTNAGKKRTCCCPVRVLSKLG
jgi:hypothetical protein